MVKGPKKKDYFTKHLFRTGVRCPTKLYYKATGYPESKQSLPFIEHAVLNKRMLSSLLRSFYPEGKFVGGDTISRTAALTGRFLKEDTEVVLFDAVFEQEQMMARLPVVAKKGDELTVFHIQTKTFDSRKHRLTDKKGNILGKWRNYLLDFAYQLHLVKKTLPGLHIRAILVMPEKSGLAFTDNLPFLLRPLEKIDKSPADISPADQELLAKLDVTDLISTIWHDSAFAEEYLPRNSFADTLSYLTNLYQNKKKEAPPIGLKCKNCEFRIEKERVEQGKKSGFNECWSPHIEADNPSEYHVFNLIGPGTNHRVMHGVYDPRNILLENVFTPESIQKGSGRISHEMRQALQIHKIKGLDIPEEIFRPHLFRELKRWVYPLHFLDFEAGNYAVPVRANRSPYHLVVFQFSCHTLHEDGSWVHHQWIDDLRTGYASYELIRQLMAVPKIGEGTIVQYSDFERTALKVIRRELLDEQEKITDAPRLIEWIEQLIHRNDSTHHEPPYIADLSRQVKNFYYNREMENSLSIKDVLQSVMSHSEFLKEKYSRPYNSHNFIDFTWWQPKERGGARNPYNLLKETGDSPIRRGTEAMVAYGKLVSQHLNEDKVEAYRKALLKYCELDTLAMVMIYEHWKQKLEKDL